MCSVQEFELRPSKAFQIENIKGFIVEDRGHFFAFINRCPHQSIPLDWDNEQFLDSENTLIQCSSHGALFLKHSGECVSGPCAGSFLTPVELSVENGNIYVLKPSSPERKAAKDLRLD